MEEFIQQLTNGLAVGGIYALIALGYTMVYGVLKLINFAHGDLFTIGAFGDQDRFTEGSQLMVVEIKCESSVAGSVESKEVSGGTKKSTVIKKKGSCLARKLSAKQRRFINEYVTDYNGCLAACRAGYSKKSASTTAGRLLSGRKKCATELSANH